MGQNLHVASVDVVVVAPAIDRDTLTRQIYEAASRAVMEIGRLLLIGKEDMGRQAYEAWVEDELPFGLDTASRYMRIYQAYSNLDEATLARLPRPWQALYALRAIDQASLTALTECGDVGPTTTVREAIAMVRQYKSDRWTGEPLSTGHASARSVADAVAADLMTHRPCDLSPRLRVALDAWLMDL